MDSADARHSRKYSVRNFHLLDLYWTYKKITKNQITFFTCKKNYKKKQIEFFDIYPPIGLRKNLKNANRIFKTDRKNFTCKSLLDILIKNKTIY